MLYMKRCRFKPHLEEDIQMHSVISVIYLRAIFKTLNSLYSFKELRIGSIHRESYIGVLLIKRFYKSLVKKSQRGADFSLISIDYQKFRTLLILHKLLFEIEKIRGFHCPKHRRIFRDLFFF